MTEMIRLEQIEYSVAERKILSLHHLLIEKGNTYGIMGPNGAGKSTLLKLLSLLDAPTKGELFFNHDKVSPKHITLEQRRKVAIALQQSLLLDTTVYQNIALGLKIRKLPRKEIKQKVNDWLEKFNITHLATKHAYQLSGGEAQRVNLARAMILEPEVLCLDEPFSALDFPTKMKLIHDFKSILTTTGTTAIFVSHDLLEIKSLTDELFILMNGELQQHGQTNDVIENPNETTASFLNEWKAYLHP
ncbi:ABC transporter ATP-binding protein [Bacillus sp. V3B]|uniref:ATP-binding cassette domain-containing protein n=1 Tax=Bacillus sp. V3B TaxID=2804915 RepID=UPI00210E9A6A|nr:ABC transporter ATP-binding protein [Bacillus sp. V3B]MCQ6275634.1 ABC transporter ATP-binding protein [Bacillus sp. V3B]